MRSGRPGDIRREPAGSSSLASPRATLFLLFQRTPHPLRRVSLLAAIAGKLASSLRSSASCRLSCCSSRLARSCCFVWVPPRSLAELQQLAVGCARNFNLPDVACSSVSASCQPMPARRRPSSVEQSCPVALGHLGELQQLAAVLLEGLLVPPRRGRSSALASCFSRARSSANVFDPGLPAVPLRFWPSCSNGLCAASKAFPACRISPRSRLSASASCFQPGRSSAKSCSHFCRSSFAVPPRRIGRAVATGGALPGLPELCRGPALAVLRASSRAEIVSRFRGAPRVPPRGLAEL